MWDRPLERRNENEYYDQTDLCIHIINHHMTSIEIIKIQQLFADVRLGAAPQAHGYR